MSDITYQRQQGGPGPLPYTPQMVSAFSLPDAAASASLRQQHVPSPSRPAGGLTSHQVVTIEQQAVMAGRPMGQGLRIEQHPGIGFIPAGFQAMCGAETAHSARVPMAAPPGYYAYPSVASLYPYGVIGQNAGASVALDPERLAAVNRALGLAQPPQASASVAAAAAASSRVPPGVMELAWRPQYPQSSAAWPAPGPSAAAAAAAAAASHVTARNPNPSFLIAPSAPPAKACATTVAAMVSSPPTNCLANNTAATAAGTTAVPPSTSATICKAADGGAAALTTMAENETDRELQHPPAHSSAMAAVAEAGDNAGDFELDSTGKRRRLTAEERLQRSRERNQLHARKTRQRKKAQLQLLQQRSADLQVEQHRLRQAITDRRTASILLGMSGSEDVQAGGRANKASRDHPPALAAMSGRTPRAGMLSALESDDRGEGSGKGVGGNGSDDLGSESASFAGTSCSGSSGRTSSEANSSDGALGGEDGGGGGGDGCGSSVNGSGGAGGGQAEEQLKVGNPGDTERLLELSQKTRSECTPEELEQIRRERNRMHAKRTRDRKKLHLEATEGMIARLEHENRKMRDSMKAMGSGVTADVAPLTTQEAPVTVAVATVAAPATTDAVVTSGAKQDTQVSGQQHSGAQVHLARPSPHPPTQQYASHAFLHHAPQMPPQLNGHVYAGTQHHLPPQVLQQAPGAHHVGYYAHGFEQTDRAGGGGGSGGGGGEVNRAGGIVKTDMSSYMPGGQMATMGCMGHSNPHYQHPHPPLVPYQLSPAIAFATNTAGKSPMPPSPQQQQAQHVYPVPSATVCKRRNPTQGGREDGAVATSPSRRPEEAQKSGRKERGDAAASISDEKNWGASSSSSSGGRGDGSKTASSTSGNTSSGNTSSGSKKSTKYSADSSPSSAGNGAARHLARARADQARAAEEKARTEDQHKLDRDLSRGCQEAWQKVRRERSAKRKRNISESGGVDGDGRRSTSSPARGASSDSGSERESGGCGGEGSECSSSSSMWMESSESSSVLPGSTTSCEDSRGCDSVSRMGSDSTRSTGSPDSSSVSESGGEDGGSAAGDEDAAPSDKLDRR